jgi:hypothetical protein
LIKGRRSPPEEGKQKASGKGTFSKKFDFGLVSSFFPFGRRKSHFTKKDLFDGKRDPNQVPFRHQIVNLSTDVFCVELVGISLFIARLYRNSLP